MDEKEPRIEAFDSLVERIFSLDGSSAPIPPLTRPNCIPVWEIQPGRAWTAAEVRHVSGCRRCQRALVTMWKANGPDRILEYLRQARDKFLWRPHVMEDLGFAAAATTEEVSVPLLIHLGPEDDGGLPLDVSIWESGHQLRILGTWLGPPEDCEGRQLGVELWDDNGSHPWRMPFRLEDGQAVASLTVPMPDELEGRLGKRVVAIAWTEPDDSN